MLVASDEVKEYKSGSVLNIDLHKECREQILGELRVVQRQMTISYNPCRVRISKIATDRTCYTTSTYRSSDYPS